MLVDPSLFYLLKIFELIGPSSWLCEEVHKYVDVTKGSSLYRLPQNIFLGDHVLVKFLCHRLCGCHVPCALVELDSLHILCAL